MADEPINLVLSSQVASRFVSSSDLETARLKREEEWKATYERLGQEAPPMPKEEYDGRSLYEKLKETKDKKQEAFEEKLKFKNQFRALDDEEVAFLDDAAEEKRATEMAKQEEIQKEMRRFKEAIASRTSETPVIGVAAATTTADVVEKASSPTSSSKTLTGATTATVNTKTTTMIPKKSRKAKDFQRAFLAGAIRPKSTADHQQGASATKKRKSLDASSTPAAVTSNEPIAPSKPSNPLDSAFSETSQPKPNNPPDPKKAKKQL
ncbi:hypothetical protein PTTG_02310 [Puccinia triticina 1-1 BBBD Race 1]|uniref:FAM192A_Fyv6_N domain-containing protein n=2 Tax=Puccinia triticina TaxID=208348 RepID=A0A180GVJ1_PUCT1|nr:uncharacterized protein PtA15_5A344 [Puccinia triticina]OAV96013.1 hypothetical protein PTTG_02310 [Puccinia triticina 1-1 BBBD Race 1]WAQ84771.1 hypothetical protein PtA15_5A344 [Puccinia triticina]WAR58110.1 hypothetical protein PtB15_5B342 [Puccinia triticina]